MKIPTELETRLKKIAENFPDGDIFSAQLDMPAFRGVRVNTLKCSREKFLRFHKDLKPTPFCEDGFYIDSNFKAGADFLHHAGAYYVQEPSATSAVEAMDIQAGDYVLDLCAAPGGKSTQIAAKLGGTGLLWSNEPVTKRTAVLISNFERMGVFNAVISAIMPDKLCENLAGVFDKVLVDAPCSGEGMLRKEPQVSENWSAENVEACAVRQQNILNSAARAVRNGGTLVYSTCTFSTEENEDTVRRFLENHSEFSLGEITKKFGRCGIGLPKVRRIFPADGGEGHFVAKFIKSGNDDRREISVKSTSKSPDFSKLHEFLSENKITLPKGFLNEFNGKFYLSPLKGNVENLGVLRAGLTLNIPNDKRFVPSHALFACPFVKCENCVNLSADSKELKMFLHGEEISVDKKLKGYVRVSAEDIPLGFGKAIGGVLKNFYPKGLRTL